jgi:LysR family hydrogen peroxide-inducible transcriptional activator
MNFTLRQLAYFLAVVEESHFGRAAERCNVSQPALSVQVRALELALGATLVERGAKGVRVTARGRTVAERARRVLEEARGLGESARRGRGLGGRLALGLIPTVAPYLLPFALPRLRAADLELDLGVREATTAALIEELRDGRIDAAVLALPSGEADFVEEPLFVDAFLLALTPARSAGLGRSPLRPEELDGGQLLLLDDGHCLADQTIAACRLTRHALRTDLRAASLATLARLADHGFGMTLLPESALWVEAAAAPNLMLRRFAPPEPSRTVGLVRRRRAADDGWFGELAAILRASAADARARAHGGVSPDEGTAAEGSAIEDLGQTGAAHDRP